MFEKASKFSICFLLFRICLVSVCCFVLLARNLDNICQFISAHSPHLPLFAACSNVPHFQCLSWLGCSGRSPRTHINVIVLISVEIHSFGCENLCQSYAGKSGQISFFHGGRSCKIGCIFGSSPTRADIEGKMHSLYLENTHIFYFARGKWARGERGHKGK